MNPNPPSFDAAPRRSPIRGLRWWIGGLLFVSTIINYIDRQTLSVLAPVLLVQYHWTNTDFATILIAFRLAYTFMQAGGGRLIDRLGARRGLSLTVTFYSCVASLTALAQGLASFRFFRFLLGAGEGPNWPGATKVASEWFPDKERAWAVAMFDSGSSIGGAIAPFLALYAYKMIGSWRPVFLVTGCLGFLWIVAWRWLYHPPEQHPRLAPEELAYIQAGRTPEVQVAPRGKITWRKLLRYRQTWGIICGRFLLDPYWFLIADWFALYLRSKGFRLEQSILGFWVPFLGADLGNFFGGALSSYWIARGWSVGRSRRMVLLIFGPSMLILIPAAFTSHYFTLVLVFGLATFAYAACSTMFLSLPSDVFHPAAVASVSGLGGTGAGIGTLISTYLIGRISDRFSFQPIVIAGSIIPCLATAVFVLMVRARKTPDPEGIVLTF
ncbi:MAG: MFS transporter [Acidobacteriota bacterium]|nr:MFS transporter [Acidobacteriota bacterium]